MPVLIAPANATIGETGADPRTRVHHIPPIHDHRPRAPAQPLHPRGHKPPVLLVPGEDHHRVCTRKNPLEIPRQPRRRIRRQHRVHPGVVHANLCSRRESRLIERLRRRVPGVVGVVDEGPAEEGDP